MLIRVRKQSCLQRYMSLFLQFCCLLPFAVAVASVVARRSQRTKRGLLELAGAIKCSTGRSALAYMVYGCYCGLGGQGWPRDKADWWGSSFNDTPLKTCRRKYNLTQLSFKTAFSLDTLYVTHLYIMWFKSYNSASVVFRLPLKGLCIHIISFNDVLGFSQCLCSCGCLSYSRHIVLFPGANVTGSHIPFFGIITKKSVFNPKQLPSLTVRTSKSVVAFEFMVRDPLH